MHDKLYVIRKRWLVSPWFLFVSAWLVVSGLYATGISSRLSFSALDAWLTGLAVATLFTFGFAAAAAIKVRHRHYQIVLSRHLVKRFWRLFYVLLGLSLIEVLVAGTIPIVSKLSGASLSHFEFGIPSVHGLVLAGYLFFSTVGVLFWRLTGQRRFLLPLLLLFIWAIGVVSRKLFMVGFMQAFMAYILITPIRGRTFLLGAVSALAVISLFGAVGQIRTGAEVIDNYGGFAEDSSPLTLGPKWVYLYATTPLHNLIYATRNVEPEGNVLFTRTTEPLVPSVVTSALFGTVDRSQRYLDAAAERYWLESEVFNVSTAGIEPYLDVGWIGISGFLIFVGALSGLVYHLSRGLTGTVAVITLMSAATLSIYSNNYVNWNLVGQMLWAVALSYQLMLARMNVIKIA